MREEQRQLIGRLAAGDRVAAQRFVDTWNERIVHWVWRRAPAARVEEYAQDVWLHIMAGNWMRLLQWQPLYDEDAWHEHSLEAYLKRLTENKVRDLLRSDPKVLLRALDPNDIVDRTTSLGNDPEVEAERSRLIEAYEFCSNRFSDRDHLMLRLWLEGHPGEYIAEQIGTNANNVYQRRSYLFRGLRDCLVEQLPGYFRRV